MKIFRSASFLFSIIFFFFSFQAFSQKISVKVFIENKINHPASDTIFYDFNRKLTWKDFQGNIPPSVPWGAMTASGFSFNSSMEEYENNIRISVGVYTFFTKHDSWKKPNINSAYHLEHEQHHFDITRLGAEKLVSEIKKAHFTKKNYRQLLNSIFDKVYEENISWQHEYDKETNNSINVEKQNEWNKKISAQVEEIKNNRPSIF